MDIEGGQGEPLGYGGRFIRLWNAKRDSGGKTGPHGKKHTGTAGSAVEITGWKTMKKGLFITMEGADGSGENHADAVFGGIPAGEGL